MMVRLDSARRYGTLFLLISLCFPVLLSAQEGERQLSLLYGRYAEQAYTDGLMGEARRLSEASLEFWPNNPDALQVSADLARQDQRYEDALSLFEQALAAGIEEEKRERVLQSSSHLAFRLGYPERAFLYLQPLIKEKSYSLDTGLLFIRLLRYIGREGDALELARELASRYAQSSQAVLAYMKLQDSFLPPFLLDNTAKPEWIEERMAPYNREIFQLLYLRLDEPSRRDIITDLYEKRFGRDLFWVFSRGLRGIETEERRRAVIQEALEDDPPGTEQEMNYYYRLLVSEDDRRAYGQWFERFSGTLACDLDGDGFFDARKRYRQGRLEEFLRDFQQDGTYDYRVTFLEGKPHKIRNGIYWYEYSDFPYLKVMTVRSPREEIEYTLYPYSIQFSFDYSTDPPLPGVGSSCPVEIAAPDLEEVVAGAMDSKRMQRAGAKKSWVVKSSFFGKERFQLIYDGEGELREQRTENGAFTIREMDPDNDGVFEIRERYLDGEKIELRYDEDGDSRPDYIESFGEQQVMLWDLNDDGLFDFREQITEDGERIREVSTKLDGNFDYRVEDGT